MWSEVALSGWTAHILTSPSVKLTSSRLVTSECFFTCPPFLLQSKSIVSALQSVHVLLSYSLINQRYWGFFFSLAVLAKMHCETMTQKRMSLLWSKYNKLEIHCTLIWSVMYLVVKYDLMIWLAGKKHTKSFFSQFGIFADAAFWLCRAQLVLLDNNKVFHVVLLLHQFIAKLSANSIDQNPMLFPWVQK